MKIGIIGSGKIGATLGELWAKAGHDVFFSSRHPDRLQDLVARLGPRARAGTPREAAEVGEVLLLAVPYAALPALGRDLAADLAGKVVIDAGNPYPERDGEMALDARARGTGRASADFLPNARLVRGFNAIFWKTLASQKRRDGEKIGIPIAGDDADALAIAARLVEDVGFEPVVVGGLATATRFDVGTPVYTGGMAASELRRALGLDQPAPPPSP